MYSIVITGPCKNRSAGVNYKVCSTSLVEYLCRNLACLLVRLKSRHHSTYSLHNYVAQCNVRLRITGRVSGAF